MALVRNFALDNRGGGQALSPFLQGRSPVGRGPFQTRPMITPKSTVAPGETRSLFGGIRQIAGRLGLPTLRPPAATAANAPTLSPKTAAPSAPSSAQTLYEFFKSDLERQRDAAIASATADAAARGVFFGTPLTTSKGDIQTEFGRGLGELQARMLQNEEQNELQRLGLASSLLSGIPQQGGGGISPDVFATIGQLFAPRQGPTGAPRLTPATTPKKEQPPLTKETLRR